MEIRRWLCYIVINCALIPFLAAKTFSINEALAAESKQRKSTDTDPSPSDTNTRFSIDKTLASNPLHKLRKYKRGSPITRKSPLFKSNNIFEFGSSRLNALLSPLRLRKRKPRSKKREIHKDVNIDEKYFPLFKNLGLLFDNLLESESRDSYEVSKQKHKRYKYKGDDKRGVVCSCALKPNSNTRETRSHKKTAISAAALSAEESSAAAEATADTAAPNFSGLRPDQDVPSVLPRDTPSGRRNDHGHGQRSGSTFHRNPQRNLSGDLRNCKYPSGIGKDEADAECDEEDTDGHPRDDADGAEPRGRGRGTPDIPVDRHASSESKHQKNKKDNVFRRYTFELPRKIQLKVGRNETESEEFLPKYIRGIRGSVSENTIGDNSESLQSKESNKEDFDGVAFAGADHQRITDRDGASSTEDKTASPRDETVISVSDLTDINKALQQNTKSKIPAVTIFDGYSVARDKNGQNKLTEKTIRIHG